MGSFTRSLATALVLFATFMASSCGRSGHNWGGSSWGGSGTALGGEKYNYFIRHLTCDDEVYFFLAADGCSGSSSGSGAQAKGQLHSVDGRELAWSCTTTDGVQGTVLIDGQNFVLSRGAVFLVSTGSGKTTVQQLSPNMSNLQGGLVQGSLRTLVSREPQVGAFLKGVLERLMDSQSPGTAKPAVDKPRD